MSHTDVDIINNYDETTWEEMNVAAQEMTATKPYYEVLLEASQEMEKINAEIKKKHEEIKELHARSVYLANLYT